MDNLWLIYGWSMDMVNLLIIMDDNNVTCMIIYDNRFLIDDNSW